MVIEGVDYAFPPRPSAAALVAAGKKFVVRYGGPGSASKHLDAAELADLKSKGLAVVANAEGAAGGFRGAVAGRSWARQAEDDFGSLGMPAGRPIYFSVDWDAGPRDWAGIDAACNGAAGVIGASRVGVYGGFDTIAHCASVGSAQWFWQTYGWSNGKWHPKCHMQQYRNGVTIDGADCDLTRAMVADYGQWGTEENVAVNQDMLDTLAQYFGGAGALAKQPNGTYVGGAGDSVWWRGIEGIMASQRLLETHNGVKALQAAVAALPGPDATAAAILAALKTESVSDMAAALKAVIGDPAKIAALAAALQAG